MSFFWSTVVFRNYYVGERVIQCDIYILNLSNNIIIGINDLYTRRQAEPMPRCSYGVEMLKIIYNASALICVSITLGTVFKFV